MEVAGANRRWRWPFRYRGSRRESAVVQLSALAVMHTSRPPFARYLYARLGPGSRGQCLGHMFSRAFGASDFTRFWRHWNPFVGYFLAYFCFAPLRRFAPRPLCLIVTFALNGFLHDLVYVWPRSEERRVGKECRS